MRSRKNSQAGHPGGAAAAAICSNDLASLRRFLVCVVSPARRAPELDNPETLKSMGRFIGRIHPVGALRRFESRPALDIKTFGDEPSAYLREKVVIPDDLRPAYLSVLDQAFAGVGECFSRAGAYTALRLHGDCHSGNVFWTDDGPHFVDFDDARNGPAVQDLWMLLSGDRTADACQSAGPRQASYLFFSTGAK